MYCKHCGAAVSEQDRYCPYCGSAIAIDYSAQANVGSVINSGPSVYVGVPDQHLSKCFPNGLNPSQYIAAQKLGFYKFIIYFQLFAAMAFYFFMAILMFTGAHWPILGGVSSQDIYSFYPDMIIADYVYGILLIVLGIYAICVRFWLSQFRSYALMTYVMLYGAATILSFLYIVCQYLCTNGMVDPVAYWSSVLPSIVSSLISAVVWITISCIYFNKRKSLFVY